MTKPSNIASIERATGKTWDAWIAFLDGKKARALAHTEIANIVRSTLTLQSAGWWAQNVTVAYEQHIGRRAAGQRSDGTFETSVTKTFTGEKDSIFALVLEKLQALAKVSGQTATDDRTSTTPVRNYWRCNLANGHKVTVSVENRLGGKVLVAVVESNMHNSDATTKEYWKQFLETVVTS